MSVAGEARLRVVLVDDAADLRTLMRQQLLVAGGFDVVAEGADGQEAVALAATFRPDLMVLDLAMPVMDGLQALPQVRQVSPASAVVMVSGFDDTVGQVALDAGAAGFLTKADGLAALPDLLRRIGEEREGATAAGLEARATGAADTESAATEGAAAEGAAAEGADTEGAAAEGTVVGAAATEVGAPTTEASRLPPASTPTASSRA
ncbi:MAG TPA: response regulator, partial [Acidimicrobiales bacterium]|nr:response regulator [Acidimicrobiales bacterium]